MLCSTFCRNAHDLSFCLKPLTVVCNLLLQADCEGHVATFISSGFYISSSPSLLICSTLMSNHYHIIVYDPHGRIADFTHHLNTHLARSYNVYWKRGENMFTPGALCQIQLINREDVVDKLAYTLVNPVAAGLVGTASAWGGPSSWRAMKEPDLGMF